MNIKDLQLEARDSLYDHGVYYWPLIEKIFDIIQKAYELGEEEELKQ